MILSGMMYLMSSRQQAMQACFLSLDAGKDSGSPGKTSKAIIAGCQRRRVAAGY
jgi:hypothetical protein